MHFIISKSNPTALFKYSIAFSILLFLAICSISAKYVSDNDTLIVWDKMTHDFGDIVQGEVVETNFTLTNNNTDTLIIENVMGSCGCLVNKWPRQPILPKMKGTITVKFNSKGKKGKHYKSVSVYTNKGAYYLSVNANILEKEK